MRHSHMVRRGSTTKVVLILLVLLQLLGCSNHRRRHIVKVHRYHTTDGDYMYVIKNTQDMSYYSYRSPMLVTNFRSVTFNLSRAVLPKELVEEEVEEINIEALPETFTEEAEESDFEAEGEDGDSSDGGDSDGSGDSGGDSGGGDGGD